MQEKVFPSILISFSAAYTENIQEHNDKKIKNDCILTGIKMLEKYSWWRSINVLYFLQIPYTMARKVDRNFLDIWLGKGWPNPKYSVWILRECYKKTCL